MVRGDGSVSDRHVDGRDSRRSVLGPDMVLDPFVLQHRLVQLRSDVRSVCRAPWLRVVRHDRAMPGRDLGGFNARSIVRGCELVLDDFDLRSGSLFVERELLGVFSSRGLRLVRGLGDVSERQQRGRDGRLAMQWSAVVVDDIGVSERSVLLRQRDVR